jgi:hypothetical protein
MVSKIARISWTTRVARCAAVGVSAAVILSIWVTVVRMFHPQTFLRLGASYRDVVGLYFVAFSLGGGFVGLLWPLCRFRIIAYPTSIFTAGIAALGAGTVLYGVPWKWDPGIWVTTSIYALIMGLGLGGSLRRAVLGNKLDWRAGQ